MFESLKVVARRVLGFSLVLLLLLSSVSAVAGDLESLKSQQNKISEKLWEIKNAIKKVDSQKENVLEELEVIEKELEEAQRKLAVTEAKLKLTQQKLALAEKELEKAEREVEDRKKTLKTRLRAMYIAGPVNYVEVLLGAVSFADFIVRIDMVKKLLEHDKNLLIEFQAKKKIVEKKRAELEAQRRLITQQYQIINSHRARIVSRQQERKKLLAELEEQKREYERQEDQLEEESRKIAEMIHRIQTQNKREYTGSGKFKWPVPSSVQVTSNYGWRTHPVYNIRRFHTGIDIGASTGDNVVAADDGVIIFAGYYGGYGNTIIVDHGGGISTLYAHLSNILVSEGQNVKRGEVIGLVGSTGISTGPHLHFEVRKDGQHINPWNWLK